MSDDAAPTRLLLSEDDTKQVWLDLATGEQIEVPRTPDGDMTDDEADEPLPPLAEAVKTWLSTTELKHEWNEGGTVVRVPFSLSTVSVAVVITVNEERRWIRWILDYDVVVPPARRAVFAEVCMRLMDMYLGHALVLQHESGNCYSFIESGFRLHTPTFEELDHPVSTLLDSAGALHAVLSGVIAGLVKASDAGDSFVAAWETLHDRKENELGD